MWCADTWTSHLPQCIMFYVNRGERKKNSFVSAHLTFLCAKLKACLGKSRFTAIVNVWFVHIRYEELASDMMLALRVESERLCSLPGSEWDPVWPILTPTSPNKVCYAKKEKKKVKQVSMPTPKKKRNAKNFLLILAQLIQSAFTLTGNHYAPVI